MSLAISTSKPAGLAVQALQAEARLVELGPDGDLPGLGQPGHRRAGGERTAVRRRGGAGGGVVVAAAGAERSRRQGSGEGGGEQVLRGAPSASPGTRIWRSVGGQCVRIVDQWVRIFERKSWARALRAR